MTFSLDIRAARVRRKGAHVAAQPMRAATVTAITHMITYAISRDRLRELVARSPATREWMLEEIRRRYPASGLVP